MVHTIRDTPVNSSGLCALSADSDNCFLAYPGSASVGEVQIFDAVNLHAKTMIPAHDSPLAALAFSLSGNELATASEKGTVIRVFSVSFSLISFDSSIVTNFFSIFKVNDGSKLFEFRRGVKRCVSIASLSFSTCRKYLCCSSNTETVHIFKLEEENGMSSGTAGLGAASGGVGSGNIMNNGGVMNHNRPGDDNWMGFFKNAVTSYLPYALPSQVTDVFTQGRAFASAVLQVAGIKHSCAITTIQKSLRFVQNEILQFSYFQIFFKSFLGSWLHLKLEICLFIRFHWREVNVF